MSVAVRAFGQQVTTHDAVQAANCFKLFASLRGAGAVLAPRLIVAFGTRRDRYQDAYAVQCYSGIAPVTESSGKNKWVHFRFACPKFLRQTFHEFAGSSIQWSGSAQKDGTATLEI